MAGSDFLDIELSAAGLQMGGEGGAIRITTRNFSYQVKAGSTVRVLTSEWFNVLSKENYQGQPIFQPALGAADAQTTLNALKAEESVLEAQIAQSAKMKGGK
jgi:hypothetical protein